MVLRCSSHPFWTWFWNKYYVMSEVGWRRKRLMREQHTSGNKKAEQEADKEAEEKMKEIKAAGKKGQDQVVKDLLKAVFDVKPVVPDRIEVPA